MNKVLQLRLSSLGHLSFAGIRRNSRIGSLVNLRVRAMAPKRIHSDTLKPVSSIVEEKKGKKLKQVMGTNQNTEIDVVENNNVKTESDAIQSLKDDQEKIGAMTVEELRTTLRSLGVSAKGRKNELLSALRCHLNKTVDGKSSHVAEENLSSDQSVHLSVNMKVNVLSEEDNVKDNDAVSELCGPKKSNARAKQPPITDKTPKASATNAKQTLTIKSGVNSGGKLSQTKRKASLDIVGEDVEVGDALNVLKESEPWTTLAHKKPQKGWVPYNPRTMRPPPLTTDTKFVKLVSWNVNGLRAVLKLKDFSMLQLAQQEEFDVLCLQETKLQEKDVESIKKSLIDGYDNSFWTCSVSKLGYSGTAIISRIKPLSVSYGLGIPDHDSEGRLVTAEFDSFYLLNGYVPNSGDGLKRLSYRTTEWDQALSKYIKELEKSKPVVLTGDLNCAHEEIDIFNPAGNKRSAGFTDEERQSFGENFLSKGLVDTFRKQHPGDVGYTYWGYRHGGRKTNKGWRLDYFLVSESIADNVHDSYILPNIMGSDHCPIGLVLKL